MEERAKKYRFVGNFENGLMSGQGMILKNNNELIKGNFLENSINGLSYIKNYTSEIEYFGSIVNSVKSGKGVYKFKNNYNVEGNFVNGNLDSTIDSVKILSKDDETIEEGIYIPSVDDSYGILETHNKNVYLLDFKNGLVRKNL